MSLPTTTVNGQLFAQSGDAADMGFFIRLTKADVDSDHGVVVPETVEVTPDESGAISVGLWPNARGSKGSQYRIWASRDACRDPVWDAYFVVPAAGPVNLRDILV